MNKIITILLWISTCTTIIVHASEKILIITHSYNRPDFIELHAKTFKAFLQDEYEYVVFNDAPQEQMKLQIEQTCNKLGVRCFRVPQNLHTHGRTSAGHRHMNGIQFALNTVGYNHHGIVTLIDSDAFLVKPFSIEKYMQGYGIAAELQGRKNSKIEVRYLNPVLAFMNMAQLPNKHTISFEGGHIHGLACDVGAHTYYYLQNNPSVKTQFFGVLHIGAWKITGINCNQCSNMTCINCVQLLRNHEFNEVTIKFIQNCPDNIEFYLNRTFLHYRSGSNWDHKPASHHAAKTQALNNLITDSIEFYSKN